VAALELRRRRAALFVALTWVAASACSLIVDTSDLSGGPVAPNDIDSSDGRVDGPVEAGPLPEAAPDTFCTHMDASFCDDFDTPPLGARWSSVAGGSLLSLENTTFKSPPNALKVLLDPSLQPHLTKSLPPAKRIHVESDVRVDATSLNGDVDLVDLYFDPPPNGFSHLVVGLVHVNGSWVLEMDLNIDDAAYYPFTADFSSWKHFAIDVDFDAGIVRVLVENAEVINKTLPANKTTSMGTQLLLGTPYADASTQWGVYFDNVVVVQQ
jgi:hypothetical protein